MYIKFLGKVKPPILFAPRLVRVAVRARAASDAFTAALCT